MNIKRYISRSFILSACLALLIGTAASCNKKSEESSDDTYMPASTAAVTAFKLKSMPDSITNAGIPLDSVFFSIDLNRGVIFNADSLPVGTNIDRLIANITYTSSASEVKLIQKGGKREGEINYKDNPSDTIDFSGSVTLSIKAEDAEFTRDYRIKVNVHKVNPDSLTWTRMAEKPLPSRLASPKQQKTVMFRATSFSLIEENDGSFTLATASDIIAGDWTRRPVALPFAPDVRSMHATPSHLGILDKSGVLFVSTDGLEWQNTGIVWTAILGCYDTSLLGIRNDGGRRLHTSWPDPAAFTEMPVDARFPIAGYSDFVQFSNKWTSLPIGFLAGGILADGSRTSGVWGFDGDHWAELSSDMIPPLADAAVVPYFVYRKTSSSLIQTEFAVWMLIGGRLADGTANRKIYVSYDNGVNWYAASASMQLPDNFPSLSQLDALMVEWPKKGSLEDNWKMAAAPKTLPLTRVAFEVEDWEVYWDCPYIYVFGGIEDSGTLNDQVWRGVLNRLTFIPPF